MVTAHHKKKDNICLFPLGRKFASAIVGIGQLEVMALPLAGIRVTVVRNGGQDFLLGPKRFRTNTGQLATASRRPLIDTKGGL